MQRVPQSDFEADNYEQHHHHHHETASERMERWSRNSTGPKEEFAGPRFKLDDDERKNSVSSVSPSMAGKKDEKMLLIVFGLMVFIGLGNKVFSKLMTIPMYNYANFLNLLTTFVYIPVCFAYIIPMAKKGFIPKEQTDMSKKPFAVMGTLDAIASIMVVFSATYLPGPLLILLGQAAIPVSMVISKYLLNATYNRYQYGGALIVGAGIFVVLAPTLNGGGSILWSIVLIVSTVPMSLSSVYKEIALGETELDPVYLNGWIAVFQFFFSIALCVPASQASEPPVAISDLPRNLYEGLLCFFGTSSITCDETDDSCHTDKCYPDAPLFVTIYIIFNQVYNLLIILILKYGSANLLYLALTLMVPLGNVVFTLPFVPSHSPLRVTDIIGLIVICIGLFCYRFLANIVSSYYNKEEQYIDEEKNKAEWVNDETLGKNLLNNNNEQY